MPQDAPEEPGPFSTLADLDLRLREARRCTDNNKRARTGDGVVQLQGAGLAARITVELVVTIAVGTGIGIGLDRWLGMSPWFLIVFLFLGGAAGIVNVYRVVKGLDDSVGLGLAIERRRREEVGTAPAQSDLSEKV